MPKSPLDKAAPWLSDRFFFPIEAAPVGSVHPGVVGSWERGLPPSRRASVSASLRRDRAEAGGEGEIAPLRRDGGQAVSA